ncbi:hypothetical protein BH23ACT9_BH23ACT9_38060 [soil metagenome]
MSNHMETPLPPPRSTPLALSRRSLLRAIALGSAAAMGSTSVAGALPALGSTGTTGLASALDASLGAGGTVLQLAVVHPQTPAHRAMLARLDDTHAIVDGGVEVLLWPGDLAHLVESGVPFRITVPDLLARDAAVAAAAPLTDIATIPGGKADYQDLDAIYAEFDALAAASDLANVVTLPVPSLEGRTVKGIEIYRGNGDDGRPVAYIDGSHHAREWPSTDYCRLFAHHLIEQSGTPRISALLDRVKVRLVPVVNVDGYVHSRSYAGSPGDNANLGIVAGGQGAYVRKNNRYAPVEAVNPEGAVVPGLGEVDPHYGVDPNRNYAYLWGGTTGGLLNVNGPGSQTLPFFATTSPNPTDQTYFGTQAFSEPDTQNTRDFFLSNAVVTYLSNHTSGRLMLRPWGHTTDAAPDEAMLKDLGQRMSNAMIRQDLSLGPYANQIGLGLYATNGTSNDWAYAATGTLGYVVEHSTSFHPAYGSTHAPGQQWPGVKEMFTIACEAAVDPASHCVLSGRVTDAAGEGVPATLTLSRTFTTPYSRNGGARDIGSLTARATALVETQALTLTTAGDGSFEWHVNPSTRPIAEIAGTTESYQLSVDGGAPVEVTIGRGQRQVLQLLTG